MKRTSCHLQDSILSKCVRSLSKVLSATICLQYNLLKAQSLSNIFISICCHLQQVSHPLKYFGVSSLCEDSQLNASFQATQSFEFQPFTRLCSLVYPYIYPSCEFLSCCPFISSLCTLCHLR